MSGKAGAATAHVRHWHGHRFDVWVVVCGDGAGIVAIAAAVALQLKTVGVIPVELFEFV